MVRRDDCAPMGEAMPELPEVETIRGDLSEHLVGRRITSVKVTQDDILVGTARGRLAETLVDREVLRVDRRGKNLIIRLAGGAALLVNLGMTGQLFVCDSDAELAEHTHVIAALSDRRRLLYRDVRRFGQIEPVPDGNVEDSLTLRNVGVDAMDDSFTADVLRETLQGRTALLKCALLDQSRVAGLGNIYICEALHRAGIDPHVRCNELADPEIDRLHVAIREVLAEAIASQGTTVSDYVTGTRVPGSFQERLRVYGREGEACLDLHCEHKIERVVQSNRATFFCPGCQGLSEANPNGSELC